MKQGSGLQAPRETNVWETNPILTLGPLVLPGGNCLASVSAFRLPRPEHTCVYLCPFLCCSNYFDRMRLSHSLAQFHNHHQIKMLDLQSFFRRNKKQNKGRIGERVRSQLSLNAGNRPTHLANIMSYQPRKPGKEELFFTFYR